MPLPRFRIRTLMIAAAVVGMVLAGAVCMERRTSGFRARSELYFSKAIELGLRRATYNERKEHQWRYYRDLLEKYDYAADHPWFSAPLEMPEPDWAMRFPDPRELNVQHPY